MSRPASASISIKLVLPLGWELRQVSRWSEDGARFLDGVKSICKGISIAWLVLLHADGRPGTHPVSVS